MDLINGVNHSIESLECLEVDFSRDGGVAIGIA